ncbi:hypothetical protein [Minwuia sp.]|uniref:hypothetical protein n=1 Tax=Minwuia sp. TaxID=2493630 RepID=UPI003A955338
MSTPADHWKPYLSGLLLHSETPLDAPTVAAIKTSCETLIAEISDKQDIPRTFIPVTPAEGAVDGLKWASLHYEELRSPPWHTGKVIRDRLNHIVVIAAWDGYVVLNFSDNAMRNQIVRRIKTAQDAPLSDLRMLSHDEMNRCLVADNIRTLWLSGTHRQSAVKADGKTLSGLELESAIDPLGDQSYYFSSIRSTVPAPNVGTKDTHVIIGTSPRNSRFWIGPTPEWNDYLQRTKALLTHVAARHADTSPVPPVLPMLAQQGGHLSDIAAPYDVSLIIPESQFPEAVPDGDQSWLQLFADTVQFEVLPDDDDHSFYARVLWPDGELGQLRFSFSQDTDAPVKLATEVTRWQEGDDADLLQQLCRNQDLLTIYFDTGHTFSRGALYQTAFRDPKFNRWQWIALDGFDLTREKPTTINENDHAAFDPARIGADDDDSLFGFVARFWPHVATRQPASGWLICDDGSMESADFIHLDETDGNRTLSLIHVKGSGSDAARRQISVSDYEIVVGQSVKNLRHLDQGILHQKLTSYEGDALADTVWHNGIRQANRSGFLDVLASFGSNYDVKVYILQPRIRQTYWSALRNNIANGSDDSANARRLKQLDTLLQGAAADCFGLGAELIVVSDAA